MLPSHLTNTWRRPRKRFRGKRAYFRRLRAETAAFRCDASLFEGNGPWHDHADWRGWGNLSWKIRRQHFEMLVAMYERIAAWTEENPRDFQLFIHFDSDDAGDDAVYVLSPETHDHGFPLVCDDYNWDQPGLVSAFEALIPGRTVRVGSQSYTQDVDDEPPVVTRYIAYCPSVGIPFERS